MIEQICLNCENWCPLYALCPCGNCKITGDQKDEWDTCEDNWKSKESEGQMRLL
jgi:hypothetical protein